MKCQSLFSQKNIILKFLPSMLTLKAPGKICSRRYSKIFISYFSEKTSLDISCESSAWQMIHMKYQDLFSSNEIVFCFS